MRQFKQLIACVLAMCMLLCLAACQEPPEPTTTPTTVPSTTAAPTTEAPNEGLILYKAAREALEKQRDIGLVISVTETMSLPAEQLVSNIRQEVSYLGLGTDGFKAVVKDSSNSTSSTPHNKETFFDGKVYIRAHEGYYISELTAEEYIARYLPAVLIDESLYESIEYSQNNYNTEVSFRNANAPEAWFPEDAVVTEASGTATINAAGKLTKFSYDVTFSVLGASVRREISVNISTPHVIQIEAPSDVSYYLPIPHPDILKLADLAYHWATSSTSISFSFIDETVSNAGAIRILDVEEVETFNNGTYMAQVDFTREYTDLQTMETSYYSQQETFLNNVYSISTNGGEEQKNKAVDQQMMRDYIYDEASYGWIGYSYMTECVASDLGNILLIEFIGCDELARSIEDGISTFLFEDEAYLDDLASKYETVQMNFYIAIDTYLGLPTAAGYSYAGKHVINGTEYMTSRTVSSTIHLASSESHMAITGEPMPDPVETESPTPLFYHVTGKNGEEMWLMGTIHVGDGRTGNLPQEILDAFSASDALALECNPSMMEEEMKDPAVAQEYANVYYYTDGTTTLDHISNTELYNFSMALMKATGFYNYMMPYLKTSMWESNISKEWLKMSYALSSDKGLDNRLIVLAKDQDKPIREVESNLFQLKMLTGWSDALAENLLGATVSRKLDDYYEEMTTLYEMWCQGDEAALTAFLKTDTSVMTAEEKALFEEYNKAMATDRNKHMAEVAIEYLESGETVFYAVGLAHVIADDGLVNALRDAGYTVELVTYE